MTKTFDPTLATERDQVRQKIGDTDVTTAQVEDETIAAYLTAYASFASPVLKTAHQLCLDLAAKWARFGTTTLDDQQQRSEGIYKQYLELARKIEIEMNQATAGVGSTGSIFVTGTDDTRGPIDPCWPYNTWPYA